MKNNIEQRMFASIGRWQRSGLKQTTWCKNNHIRYSTFHYWYKRYRSKVLDTDTPANTPGFVQVMMDTAGTTVVQCELALPDGRRLTFHQPVSADFLRTLIG